MKILHIITGLEVGGAEMALRRLVDSHRGSSHFMHEVISLTDVGVIGKDLLKSGVKVSALQMGAMGKMPAAFVELVRKIKSSEADIVQTWMYHADFLGGLAAWVAGNRNVIWGVRTTDVELAGNKRTVVLQYVCGILSRLIPRYVVCVASAAVDSHLRRGFDRKRMVVIPNGFDLDRLKATPAQIEALGALSGLGGPGFVIGTVGRFNVAKGYRDFINAVGTLLSQHEHLKVLMVGRGLEYSNPELVEWISATGHAERFVLLGERDDVAACLSLMDVFCLSSKTEGFPNVVGEAMGVGVPCVVTDVGDAALVVGDAGIVVPRDDVHGLAAGLMKIFSLDANERLLLGKRARQRIMDEFTQDRTRDRFEAVYRAVLKKGNGKR